MHGLSPLEYVSVSHQHTVRSHGCPHPPFTLVAVEPRWRSPSVGSRHTDLRLDERKLQNLPSRLSDRRMLPLIIHDFLASAAPYLLVAGKRCAGLLS
jgi:hypothetical protein